VPLWFWSRPNSMLDPPAWHWLPGLTAVTWTAARGIFRLASTHVPVSTATDVQFGLVPTVPHPARPDSAHSSADPTWAGGTVSHAGYSGEVAVGLIVGQSTPPRRPAAPIPRLPAHCDFDCGHEFFIVVKDHQFPPFPEWKMLLPPRNCCIRHAARTFQRPAGIPRATDDLTSATV